MDAENFIWNVLFFVKLNLLEFCKWNVSLINRSICYKTFYTFLYSFITSRMSVYIKVWNTSVECIFIVWFWSFFHCVSQSNLTFICKLVWLTCSSKLLQTWVAIDFHTNIFCEIELFSSWVTVTPTIYQRTCIRIQRERDWTRIHFCRIWKNQTTKRGGKSPFILWTHGRPHDESKETSLYWYCIENCVEYQWKCDYYRYSFGMPQFPIQL